MPIFAGISTLPSPFSRNAVSTAARISAMPKPTASTSACERYRSFLPSCANISLPIAAEFIIPGAFSPRRLPVAPNSPSPLPRRSPSAPGQPAWQSLPPPPAKSRAASPEGSGFPALPELHGKKPNHFPPGSPEKHLARANHFLEICGGGPAPSLHGHQNARKSHESVTRLSTRAAAATRARETAATTAPEKPTLLPGVPKPQENARPPLGPGGTLE